MHVQPKHSRSQGDDPTINLLCQIAAFNEYGGLTVVNGIPLRSATPAPALQMLEWYRTGERYDRDRLQDNVSHIRSLISKAGTVLLAWGALAGRTESSINWFDRIQEEIAETLPDNVLV